MKKIFFILLALVVSLPLLAQWSRTGRFIIDEESVANVKPDIGLGLEAIFVFKNLLGATLTYQTGSGNAVKMYTYDNSLADMKDFTSFNNDNGVCTISNLPDNKALVVEDNGVFHCVWLIDYNLHKPILRSITAVESDDKCEALKLVIDKDDLLEYRGNAGQVRQVVREYDIVYQRLKWYDDDSKFVEEVHVEDNLNIGTEIILSEAVPNMNTQFIIRGDQFGKKFKIPEEKISNEYEAVSVEAHIKYIQAPKDAENEGQEGITLGGSAPIDIEFLGHANEPVTQFYTWFVYKTTDMNNPIARYTDKSFDYTFEQEGDYQVVLEVANGESSCVTTESVSFNITNFELEIPNYFSPGSTPGSNDEFRVYYKSIVKYHCVIFNRWGNKVFESRDPAQGWDGRYKGSLVNPGVYFYSIVAKGSDGKTHKRGGDINILR